MPFLAVPWVLRDRRTRFLFVQFALCFAAMLTVIWFNPHYMAPALATLFALLVQMMRHLRRWEFRGKPVGIGLTRMVVLLTLVSFASCLLGAVKNPNAPPRPGWLYFSLPERADLVQRLEAMPGQQLVIVRYSEEHHPVVEWVYNGADPDHEKIVWAREIPGIDLKPLLDYYPHRQVWMIEPDVFPVPLKPYVAALH